MILQNFKEDIVAEQICLISKAGITTAVIKVIFAHRHQDFERPSIDFNPPDMTGPLLCNVTLSTLDRTRGIVSSVRH